MNNTIQNSERNSRRHFIKNASLAAAGLYITPSFYHQNNLITQTVDVTRYGCLFLGLDPPEAQLKMTKAGFDLVRVPLYLADGSSKKALDNYLSHGFSVQINLNWQSTHKPSTFPEPGDYPILLQRAKEFFKKYIIYKDQIPLICLGNEWDNLNYHTNDINYYLDALKAGVIAAHQYGFKVADAALSGTSLQRWMYSQLSGTEAAEWKKNYWVGENNENYQPLLDKVEHYISRIKHINIDYLNVHWENKDKSSNGFPKAAGHYLSRCQQKEIITNEFGQKTPDFDVWEKTVAEVSSYETDEGLKTTRYALAFSGQNQPDRAVELTDDMLKLLANPTSKYL